MHTLKNWSVCSDETNPYLPPEHHRKYLMGEVHGNPDRPDGQKIATSYIRSISGDVVTTASGSKYKLENPSQDYLNYLKEKNLRLPTPEEPIRLIKEDAV